MIIYRDGKEIRLTLEEMQAAHKQLEHIYRLETAEEYFRAKINYEEYEGDERWISLFVQEYGFTPEQAMDPDSPHYAMEELLALYEELQTDFRSEDSIWDTAVQTLLNRKCIRSTANQETLADKTGSDVPVKFRFYAVMEDGFEYSEIRDFSMYPSARELEALLREFKQEAEDMNDSTAVSFGSEYAGTVEKQEAASAEKASAVTIPDDVAALFGTAEGKQRMMADYSHINTAYSGINQDGEKILLEISPDKIKYTCYQHNGWIRSNWSDEKGQPNGESYEGRWK